MNTRVDASAVSPARFWHITDLHLDPTYHQSPDPTKVCFSSKGVPVTQAGMFGDFLCDSPYSLITSAFRHMAGHTAPQDFVIWTGSVGEGLLLDSTLFCFFLDAQSALLVVCGGAACRT